ncbi:di-trans,poly-cis-decaprenylcistransferase [Candidatus Woesebacteria bacterium]|nr:di-trans,poly-cis-decaprenylcistransferase [Candidatus Woesebacteria bacterium]
MTAHKAPTHVAIICDGNRRWARQKGLAAVVGHERATELVFEPLIKRSVELGISYLTFWVFSTENWNRDPAEVSLLMQLFRKGFTEKIKLFKKNNVRLRIIGDLSKFPEDIRQKVLNAVEETKSNTQITVTFAMNYGGRDELVRAIRRMAADGVALDTVTEEDISTHLDTGDLPDPDLIIRTGGEQRLSGFLLWQCQYAELFFSDQLYPDFSADDFQAAVEEYTTRQRRFGG